MVFARACAVVGLVGSALVVLGSLGPWATISSSSVSGVDGGRDGWITLVLALLAAGFLAGVFAPKGVARVLRWFPLPFALLILLVALVNVGDIASTNDEFSNQLTDETFSLSIGWGLWLVVAGSIAIGVPSAFLMFAPMPVPAHHTPPVPSAYSPGWHPRQPYLGQYPAQQYPAQPYPPQPYPPQSYPSQYPPQGQPPPAPAAPAWPTTGPAYPGSTDSDGGSSD